MQYFRQRKYIIFVIFNKKGRKKPRNGMCETTSGVFKKFIFIYVLTHRGFAVCLTADTS